MLPPDCGIACILPALTHSVPTVVCLTHSCLSCVLLLTFCCDYILIHTFPRQSLRLSMHATLAPTCPHISTSVPTNLSHLSALTYTYWFTQPSPCACSQQNTLGHAYLCLHTPVHTCFPVPTMLIPPSPLLTMPAMDTRARPDPPVPTCIFHFCPHLPVPAHSCIYQYLLVPISSSYTRGFPQACLHSILWARKGPKVQKLMPRYFVAPRLAWVELHRQQHSADRSPAEGSSASAHAQQPHVPGPHCYIPAPFLPGRGLCLLLHHVLLHGRLGPNPLGNSGWGGQVCLLIASPHSSTTPVTSPGRQCCASSVMTRYSIATFWALGRPPG